MITTGALFGLLTVAHLARMFVERRFATDPAYWAITALAAALCGWAVYLLRRGVAAPGDSARSWR